MQASVFRVCAAPPPFAHPSEEPLEGLEGHVQEARPRGLLEHHVAELKDLAELFVQPLLERLGLGGRHLVFHFKHLLREQLQNLHVVLAQHLCNEKKNGSHNHHR
jgi:hypothetical protein